MATSRDSSNLSFAALVGATAAVIFLTALIIAAEESAGLKSWLKEVFSHHWVGKSILGTIMFFLSGAFAAGGLPRSETTVARAGLVLFWTTVLGLVVLTAFFFFEAFIK